MLKIDSDFLKSIKEAQKEDVKFVDLLVTSNQTEDSDFKVDDLGVLRFQGRICIPDNEEIKKMILEESHRSSLSIHPGATNVTPRFPNIKISLKRIACIRVST